MKYRCWLGLFCAVTSLLGGAAAASAASTEFVTREGDHLMEAGRVFRFASFNLPDLHVNEDPEWHPITAWEQEDALRSVSQMGGRVIRIYTLSVAGGKRNVKGPSHVYGPGNYDEALLRDYDRMLALCAKYHVRVIIPFLDEWDWWGGIDEFSRFRGVSRAEFYSDSRVQEDFRAVVKMLVTRVNTVTGVAYKDDPTILAWESGNELRKDPESWVSELAAYVKQLAPHQLFQDGHCGPREALLTDPNIDLFTNHYYGEHNYASLARHDREITRGRKAFYVGEYDPRRTTDLVDEVCANGSSGILVWSLRGHTEKGGFFWHDDPLFYHWPFSPITKEIRRAAFRLAGESEPPLEIPLAPELLPIKSTREISWKGSVGAESYQLERATKVEGPWLVVGKDLSDHRPNAPLYNDETAPATSPLYYRLRAQNSSGVSEYSPVLKVGR